MTTATQRRTQPAPGWERHSADVPVEEFEVIRTRHPNVLIGGRPEATAAALGALQSVFRPNVVHWKAGVASPLPLDETARTLILDDVDALSLEEQRQFLRWLREGGGKVQVVSTTATPLWPLVELGKYDLSLYYALNVVYLNLSS
jgi:hypothetical protein